MYYFIPLLFILIRVQVQVLSTGFSLRLVQASPAQVSIYGHLYKDNSTRVHRQSPVQIELRECFAEK